MIALTYVTRIAKIIIRRGNLSYKKMVLDDEIKSWSFNVFAIYLENYFSIVFGIFVIFNDGPSEIMGSVNSEWFKNKTVKAVFFGLAEMRVQHLSIATAVTIPRNNTVITILLKGTKKLLYSGRGTRKNLICMRFSAVFRFLFTARPLSPRRPPENHFTLRCAFV